MKKITVFALMFFSFNFAMADDAGLYAFDVTSPGACEAIDGESLTEESFQCMEMPTGQSMYGEKSVCTNGQTALFVFHSASTCAAGLDAFKAGN